MTSALAFRRLAFTFGGAVPVLYVVVLFRDVALFTVYPSLGLVMLGTHHSREVADPALGFLAPEMYWYGWTATAAVGALAVGLFAILVPDRWTQRLGSVWVWVLPLLGILGCAYFELPWFRR
jgi:amino acid permease